MICGRPFSYRVSQASTVNSVTARTMVTRNMRHLLKMFYLFVTDSMKRVFHGADSKDYVICVVLVRAAVCDE